jgi:hypothetical protein
MFLRTPFPPSSLRNGLQDMGDDKSPRENCEDVNLYLRNFVNAITDCQHTDGRNSERRHQGLLSGLRDREEVDTIAMKRVSGQAKSETNSIKRNPKTGRKALGHMKAPTAVTEAPTEVIETPTEGTAAPAVPIIMKEPEPPARATLVREVIPEVSTCVMFNAKTFSRPCQANLRGNNTRLAPRAFVMPTFEQDGFRGQLSMSWVSTRALD